MPKVVTVDSKGHDNMVMVPVKARAGYLNGYGDQEFVGSLPSFRLPGYTNGTFRMFEVEGFSMYNTLHDKDLIATEFVENIDQVRDGRIYVIVTQQYGVVIKRVLNRIKTDNKLVLKSDAIKDRHLHPPIIISPDDVLEIWYVKGKLTRQLPGPEDIFARMDAIEAELAILQHNRLKTEP